MNLSSPLIFLWLLCGPLQVFADCTLDNSDNLNGFLPLRDNTLQGQHFLACESGVVESILLNIQSPGVLEFYLTNGEGTTIDLDVPYEVFPTEFDGMITFVFTEPFPVEQGQLYAFGLRGTQVNYDASPTTVIDPAVADGQSAFLIDPSGFYRDASNSDLYFKIQSRAVDTVADNATIPTMSQWGLLIYGLLLLNLGVFFLKSFYVEQELY